MAHEAARILVVDDEPDLRDLLATSLRFAGFSVDVAASGRAALDALAGERFDLVLMDVMMPHMDGFTAVRKMRARADATPVVFLTAKDTTDDALAGFGVGADDYITKPFSLALLVARVEAVLRRTRAEAADDTHVLRVADLTLDTHAHEVSRAGVLIELTALEFSLLHHLMLNAGRVQSKAQLLDHVWGYAHDADGNLVETYISYLRRKVDAPFGVPLIHTKRGVGYVLKAEGQARP